MRRLAVRGVVAGSATAVTLVLSGGVVAASGIGGAPGPDMTGPEVAPEVAGRLGLEGWYVSDVAVSWSVEDPDSPLSAISGCGSTAVTRDTAGTTFTCTATSAGGTTTRSVRVKRDATAPQVASELSSAANAAGAEEGLEISYTCSDATSGLMGRCLDTDHPSAEGVTDFTQLVLDRAGNSAEATTTVKLHNGIASIVGSSLR